MTERLLARELIALLVCTGVGVFFTARFPIPSRAIRLALAPAVGFAVLATALLSVAFLMPLRYAGWPIVAIALAGAVTGGLRLWRERPVSVRAPRTLAAVIVGVGLVVASAVPFNGTMGERQTYGPIGVGVFDADAYIQFSSGYRDAPTRQDLLGLPVTPGNGPRIDLKREVVDGRVVPQTVDTTPAWGERWDLALTAGSPWAFQHSGAMTVVAALSPVAGIPAWQFTTVFVGALLIALAFAAAGAGAFLASAAGIARDRDAHAWWAPALAALLAGALAGAGVLLSITYDGSLALLSASVLLPVLAVLTCLLVERATVVRALALGGMLAALQTIYPELLPSAAFGGIALLISLAISRRDRLRSEWRRAVATIAVVVATALVLAPRATGWTAGYIVPQIFGETGYWGIDYRLPLRGVLGWLSGTTDFYLFSFGGPLPGVLSSLIVPIGLVLLTAAAAWLSGRVRVAALLSLGFLLAGAFVAYSGSSKGLPTYSAQRALAGSSALLVVTAGAALAALAGRGRLLGAAALMLAGAWVALGSQATHAIVDRAERQATTPPIGFQALLDDERVESARDIAVEGIDTTPIESILMGPTMLLGLTEGRDARTSYPDVGTNEWGALDYLGMRTEPDVYWTPDYDLVVSRLNVPQEGRRLLATYGPYRLLEPADRYDVTVTGGVATFPSRIDPSGSAWLQRLGATADLARPIEPLTLWVRADSPERAFVRATIVGEAPVTWERRPPGAMLRRRGAETFVCAPVHGTSERRAVELPLLADVPPPQGSTDARHPGLMPATGALLASVGASTRPCR